MHDANANRAAQTFQPLTASAVLVNPVGLHARPSVKLTQLAKSFTAKIEIALAADGPWTDAKSPVKV
ncbi:HPr family phosphocarrier protein, partial [Xanthomonas citri pv. citri]